MNKLRIPVCLAALLFVAACASAPATDVVPYPSDVCIVTDNKLGSMGDPVVKVYGKQEVKFCCRPCVKEFEEDPQRFLKKLAN
ncbi:MAG: hypothetical protein KAI24_09040 [Planctomycetes bacterium]|nr:hypothetical protein [Planctomycetota bacterium]